MGGYLTPGWIAGVFLFLAFSGGGWLAHDIIEDRRAQHSYTACLEGALHGRVLAGDRASLCAHLYAGYPYSISRYSPISNGTITLAARGYFGR